MSDWQAAVSAFITRERSPLRITVEPQR
jgi:hypothetical protein